MNQDSLHTEVSKQINMKDITKFLTFKNIVRSYGGTVSNASSKQLDALIEDIIFEVNEYGTVTTERIFDNIIQFFRIDDVTAHAIITDYSKFVKDNKIFENYDAKQLQHVNEQMNMIAESADIVELKQQLIAAYKQHIANFKLTSIDSVSLHFNL